MRRILLLLSISISGGLLIFPRIPILFLLIILCALHIRMKFEFSNEFKKIYLFMFAFLTISIIRPGDISIESVISRLLHFIVGLLMLQIYLKASFSQLIEDLNAILQWFPIQAIATIILFKIVPGMFSEIYMVGQRYTSILYLLNLTNESDTLNVFPRASGFFFEPGVFQIYLNIYLYIALYIYKDIIKTVLSLLGVLATQSTTGLLIAVVLLSISLFRSTKEYNNTKRFIITIVILIITIPLSWIAYNNYNEKVEGTKKGSYWSRNYDFYTGLNIISENPIFGIGFDIDKYLNISNEIGYTDTDLPIKETYFRPSTNSIVQSLYTLGIPLGSVLLICIFYQKIFPDKLPISILLLLSFSSEAVIFAPFFIFILFSALITFSKDKVENNRKLFDNCNSFQLK